MTTTLTARGPEDLLAAVPVVLGFRPHDSLVLLTFDAAQCFHARVGLPPPDEVDDALPDLVEALVAPCLQQRVGRVALIAYTDDARVSAALTQALGTAFDEAGIGVVAAVRAHDGVWWEVPVDPAGRESPPTPYDETTHPFAAQAVFDGRVTHPSRDHLRATVGPASDAVARVAALQAARHRVDPTDAEWVVSLVTRCAASREPPDDEEAARALGALVRTEVRDAALYAVPRHSALAHLQVWADLLRRAPRRQVPDTATLTAFCAWQAGDGALAWCALERCFEVDPHHPLGLCLAECLTRAVPPSAWHDADPRGPDPSESDEG